MKRTISATEARMHFGELMRRVVERAEYERLRESRSDDWRAQLDAVYALIRREHENEPFPPPEEIIRAMREERDEQLLDHLR